MFRIVAWSSVGLAFALVVGCSRRGPSEAALEDAPAFREPANAVKADSKDTTTLAGDNTRFALDLHRRLGRTGNLVASPFAVSTVLGMSLAGARGETADEMKKALRCSLALDQFHPTVGALLWDLHGRGKMKGYSLRLASGLWIDRGLDVKRDFLDSLEGNYSAGRHSVDFKDRQGASRAINDWARKQTAERIGEVITPGELDANTRLVLASAVYFRGQWHHRFSPGNTKEGPFHVSAERTVDVPLMEQEGKFEYYPPRREAEERFQMVILPFRGRAMQFIVLLPRKVEGLPELEKTLTQELLDRWIDRSAPFQVQLTLPRFEMRSRLALVEPLEALGMKKAFKETEADFSGVTTTMRLHINRVVQEATVVVNEEGAEAAAVAHGAMKDKSKGGPEGEVEFRADRPFLFLIRHARTGTILFLGRVSNPAG
jgi:serpin B